MEINREKIEGIANVFTYLKDKKHQIKRHLDLLKEFYCNLNAIKDSPIKEDEQVKEEIKETETEIKLKEKEIEVEKEKVMSYLEALYDTKIINSEECSVMKYYVLEQIDDAYLEINRYYRK